MNQKRPISTRGYLRPFFSGILMCLLLIAWQTPPLQVRQQGSTLRLRFPVLGNRSIIKVLNDQGDLLKGALADAQTDQFQLQLPPHPKGVYYVLVENRVQRFSTRVLLY